MVQELTKLPDPHQDTYSKTIFGFWIYLMTDCIIFATLFATYAVLHTNTFGGPSPKDIFHIPTVIAETSVLLLSSFTSGLGMVAAARSQKNRVFLYFGLAFLLGASFVVMEVREFTGLIREGHSFTKSAFLSSFFTLVGTHGFHVSIGLLWLLVLFFQILKQGITIPTFRRISCFNMFWHFLDLIWIFIFTLVYLTGVL